MKYTEMQNFNEELLLYLGWFFQLSSPACRSIALETYECFASRMIEVTQDEDTKNYIEMARQKAQHLTK